MQPTQKLTNSPFGHSGTKITGPIKNTIPVQINNYSPSMSQKYKGKQSNNIHRQKLSKIQCNRKIEKSLQVAQKRGTLVLQVSNPKTFGN
jgi:hypothetical protein